MILTTSSGDYPIPPAVAARLPSTPPLPDPDAPDGKRQMEAFRQWLEASPDHGVAYERLRRWHVIQDERAARAKAEGQPFEVTEDGLE